MDLNVLFSQYKHFNEILIASETLRESLNELPDDMELTVSFEKMEGQPGGVIKNGQVILNKLPKKPKTVAERKQELDNDIKIVKARVGQLKRAMVKELQKDDQ